MVQRGLSADTKSSHYLTAMVTPYAKQQISVKQLNRVTILSKATLSLFAKVYPPLLGANIFIPAARFG